MSEELQVIPENEANVPQEYSQQVLPLFPTKDQIKEYQEFLENYDRFISSVLKDGTDFGTLPGVPKPSLFKPGAEKLEKLFFLTHEKVRIEKVLNDEYCSYTYKTVVYEKSGRIKATCEGTCNSKEKKYQKQLNYGTIYDLENTIMKMAQKRSYVGAILESTNSSGRFTQDVEDMDLGQGDSENTNRNSYAPKKEDPGLKRASVIKELYDLLKSIGKTDEWLMTKIGKPLSEFSTEGLIQVLTNLRTALHSQTKAKEPVAPVMDHEKEIPIVGAESTKK